MHANSTEKAGSI